MIRWWRHPGQRFSFLALVAALALTYSLSGLRWLDPLAAWLISMTLVTFVAYGYDKAVADSPRTRVPEWVLLALALAGGSLGALVGMRLFRHKTRKWQFQLQYWVIVLVQAVLIAGYYLWLRPQLVGG